MKTACSLLGLAFLGVSSTSIARDLAPAEIYTLYGRSVGLVEFTGDLFNGEQEQGAGSGFLLTPNVVLTCKHVLPNEANYRSTVITVKFGKRASTPLPAKVLWVSPTEDVALLNVANTTIAPIPINGNAPSPGKDVVALGFPLQLNLSITKGIISGDDTLGKFTMDTAINPGNSGGPVVGGDGRAIGVAWGAHLKWKTALSEIPLQNISLFVPFSSIKDIPGDVRSALRFEADQPPRSLARTIVRSFPINVTKDDHPVVAAPHSRDYSLPFEAEPRYRIVRATLVRYSDTKFSLLATPIAPDGKNVQLNFRLTSGPLFDRYRGWVEGTLELTQELIE